MRYSIVQTKKECLICGAESGLEMHEAFFGKNRKKSIENGCCVYLCQSHHRGTNGAHGKHGHDIDEYIKRRTQAQFEALRGREEFLRVFGRNYMEV